MSIKDFTEAFNPLTLPFSAADSNLVKMADTTVIGIDAIKQFIPDSILQNHISNQKKAIFHPV
ncbi:hypothetical protein ABTM82_20045, partial [Acinetobacter baumannii]